MGIRGDRCGFRAGVGAGAVLVVGAGLAFGAEPVVLDGAGGVRLALDTARLAVYHPEGDEPLRVADPFAGSGLVPVSSEPWPIPGWSLVTLAAPLADDRDALDAALDQLAASGVWASPVFVGLDAGPVWATPTLLVSDPPADADAFGVVEQTGWGRGVMIRSDAAHGLELIERAAELNARDAVAWAEPEVIFTGSSAGTPGDPLIPETLPNDPLFLQQWALISPIDFDTDAPRAWEITEGDPGILVMIIDTGVELDHPDLNVAYGYDFTTDFEDGGPVNSFDRHGTPVAGCVSAMTGNGVGVAGLASRSPSVSARCFISIDASGSWTSSSSWSVNAIAAARQDGIRVTNNSNFYGFTSNAFESQLSLSRAGGMVHFASAGNNGALQTTYPASLPTVNAIASSTEFGGLAPTSNFGPQIFLTAPGHGVLTTDNTGSGGYSGSDYASVFGTSFASPHAAAVAALVLSVDPGLSASEVEQILADSADPFTVPGLEGLTGAGHLNAFKAVLLASGTSCPADFNGDETINVLDVLGFIGSWSGAGPSADFNGDGAINVLDVIDFITTWNAGCP